MFRNLLFHLPFNRSSLLSCILIQFLSLFLSLIHSLIIFFFLLSISCLWSERSSRKKAEEPRCWGNMFGDSQGASYKRMCLRFPWNNFPSNRTWSLERRGGPFKAGEWCSLFRNLWPGPRGSKQTLWNALPGIQSRHLTNLELGLALQSKPARLYFFF